jgi:hypothetical protein
MDGERDFEPAPPLKIQPLRAVEAVGRFTGLEPERFVSMEAQAERSRRWATRTLMWAVLLLAVCNARAMQTWASTLPPNWASVTARALAAVWGERMAAAGLDRPRAVVHDAYSGAKAVTWRQVGGVRMDVVNPK